MLHLDLLCYMYEMYKVIINPTVSKLSIYETNVAKKRLLIF